MKSLCLLALLPLALPAEIILTSPAPGSEVSEVSPVLREFWNHPELERRKLFNDLKYRSGLQKNRNAVPVVFSWRCTEGEKGPFRVTVSEGKECGTMAPVLRIPGKDEPENEARYANFLLGCTYSWQVSGVSASGKAVVSKTAFFMTTAQPPRLLMLPNTFNVRDLGGYKGLDGKMVRQGMIFRTAGLNDDSPKYGAYKKKQTKDDPRTFPPGKTRLTPETKEYIAKVLNWKTDLDLRGAPEVGSMNASPAGETVRWVLHPSKPYGGMFSKTGKEMTVKNFRLFCDRTNYPIAFHCIAGADRTGSLAWVLEAVLGVSEEDMIRDWEITANPSFVYEKRLDLLRKGFDKFGKPGDPMRVKVENYLRSGGIKEEELAAFREIMLETGK